MSLAWWKRLRRSLLGQMSALTVIFLIFAVFYFAVLPYMRFVVDRDPVERTRGFVSAEIFGAIAGSDGRSLEGLPEVEVLQEIAAANERFRYYVSDGDHTIQHGAPPKWLGAIDFAAPDLQLFKEVVDPEECNTRGYWSGKFDDDGVEAYVSYRECNGEETYIEYGGIDVPVAKAQAAFSSEYLRFFWVWSKQSIIASAGFILIAGFVLFLARRSLRRVTSVAESFDVDQSDGESLPEKGIPSEVLPLIQAINKLVARVQQSQEQQKFFLATAAHEMRTPMAILRTRLEELPDSETKNEIRDDVRRITTLVEQLLRLMSVRNTGDLPGEVELVTLARTVIAERAPLAIEKGVEIELDADVEAYRVNGDEGLLGVALANLVDNAISFSRRGDALRVTIDRKGSITVQDQGPGIGEDDIESIFEPFAKNPPNRKGHGLGLAIVKAIMSLHGGGVSAANSEAGGARFALEF